MILSGRARKVKPPVFEFDIDEMTDEEAEAANKGFWTKLMSAAEQQRHGHFRESRLTAAICNAGPTWKPGDTLAGFTYQAGRYEEIEA